MNEPKHKLGRPQDFAFYDSRGYATLSLEDGYTLWARAYTGYESMSLDLLEHSPNLTKSLKGSRAVDLACGTGLIGEWLSTQGAKAVVGVDLSEPMLQAAEQTGVYSALHRADIAHTHLEPAQFDVAFVSLALCHLKAIQPVYKEAKRLLRKNGCFYVVDYHPYFLFRGIPSHFNHPETGEPKAVVNHIHPLSDHFKAAMEEGLSLFEFEERFVDRELVAGQPSYEKHLGWPLSFLMAFERPA